MIIFGASSGVIGEDRLPVPARGQLLEHAERVLPALDVGAQAQK